MDIFESLENLNVSEECFDEIMGIVEELLSEGHESALMKKYGVDSIQKLPKEVRRKYFPNTRHSVEDWDEGPKMYVRGNNKSRSHHRLSQYQPKKVEYTNQDAKFLPKNVKKVLGDQYGDISDSTEREGRRITKNDAGHEVTDSRRFEGEKDHKVRGTRVSGKGVNTANPGGHSYLKDVTPQQYSAGEGDHGAGQHRDSTLKKFKK